MGEKEVLARFGEGKGLSAPASRHNVMKDHRRERMCRAKRGSCWVDTLAASIFPFDRERIFTTLGPKFECQLELPVAINSRKCYELNPLP